MWRAPTRICLAVFAVNWLLACAPLSRQPLRPLIRFTSSSVTCTLDGLGFTSASASLCLSQLLHQPLRLSVFVPLSPSVSQLLVTQLLSYSATQPRYTLNLLSTHSRCTLTSHPNTHAVPCSEQRAASSPKPTVLGYHDSSDRKSCR